MEVVSARLEQVAENLEPLRAPGPPVLRAGPLPFAFAFRSRFSCHPEPIRAKRGWVRDPLLLSSSVVRPTS